MIIHFRRVTSPFGRADRCQTTLAVLLIGATAIVNVGQANAAGPAAAPAAPTITLTADDDTRFKHLSEELRCLVCQNQSLSDSNADLAVDLRNQVKGLISQGRSNDEIKTYLVDRYGQFVLYKPPVQRSTWLLWGGPFGLLGIGLLVWWRIGRHAPTSTPATLSDASLESARRLLDDR